MVVLHHSTQSRLDYKLKYTEHTVSLLLRRRITMCYVSPIKQVSNIVTDQESMPIDPTSRLNLTQSTTGETSTEVHY